MLENAEHGEIHERLLAGDPTASVILIETLLPPLIGALNRKYPQFRDSDLLMDAVTDALMSYVKRPAQFDPKQRSLLGYLIMSADGDFQNALAKRRRRRRRELSLEDVEVEMIDGNEGMALEDALDTRHRRQEVYALFDDPKDHRVIDLILNGERSTEAFAAVLQLDDLSLKEKRREVKRHKDRIKKRLERYGDDIR